MARTSVSIPFSGARLRSLRERAGWSQADLSDRTADAGRRIGQDRVSRYETGALIPSATTLGILIKTLRCRPEELLDSGEAA